MTAAAPPALYSRRSVTWLDLLAVFVVTVAVFTPVLHGQFAPLDDQIMLPGNPQMSRPTWAGLASFWSEPKFRIYMPLTLTVWQAVALVSSVTDTARGMLVLLPPGFKYVSVLAHALSAVAAVWTLSRLAGVRWPAVAGGLLFALHPLQVESVAWTTGLKDVLCGLFTILALGCYATHVRRPRPRPFYDVSWWLAFGAALLATFSKSTAVVMPALLLAVDLSLRRCPLAVRVGSLGAFVLPSLAGTLVILNAQFAPHVPRVALSLRGLLAADSYTFYLGKVVWPFGMAIDYGRNPARVLASGALARAWIVPALLLVGLAVARSRLLWLAAALFVIPVLPTSGLVPFDMQQYSTVADHYAYQPMLGVGLAVAVLLKRWPRAGVAVPLVLAGLAVLTWRGAVRWQTPEPVYREVLAVNPQSWLGRDLLITLAMNRGDFRDALRLSDEIERVNPDDPVMLEDRAILELWLGRYRSAVDYERRAIPHLPLPDVVPGHRLMLLGAQLHDPDVAREGVKLWLAVEPGNPFALNVLRAIDRDRAASRPAATPSATRPSTEF